MKVEVKKLDKLKHAIKVEVSGEEFLKEKKEVYRQSSKKLKVPGFRPGSAPADILEKHHGDFLKEEFLKNSLSLFYRQALEEKKIIPASLPRIYDVKVTSDTLTFSAEFEIKPQVEVKEALYKGIKIKDQKIKVDEIEIEKVLTNLKEGIKKVISKDLEDADLAKWASHPDAASLREAIKAQLSVEKLSERRQKIDSQVKKHLLKAVNFDLPKDGIDRHHKELVAREVNNLRLRGISGEDIDKYKKDLEDKLRPLAEDEVKLYYILEAVANAEGIKPDNNLGDVVFGFIMSQAVYE